MHIMLFMPIQRFQVGLAVAKALCMIFFHPHSHCNNTLVQAAELCIWFQENKYIGSSTTSGIIQCFN